MPITLASERIDVEGDIEAFSAEALRRGWSDGLPCVPPTEDRVKAHVLASGLAPDYDLGTLYPSVSPCSVELLAVNAVMAGAPQAAMPLLCAAVVAMTDPVFDLGGINTTTASVVPAVIVNGPVRDELDIPYRLSAFGGMPGIAPAIGRALRFVMRNVAGQIPGETCEVVFGQPARVAGIVLGEWEEESPWPPLAERRGVAGSAVTLHGALGTASIFDSVAETGLEILEVIGKSLGYMGNNNYGAGSSYAEQVVAINPIWAEKIAKEIPSFAEVREIIFKHASHPIDAFPRELRPALEKADDIRDDGRVYLMDSPSDLQLIVCGGKGSLHAMMMPGMTAVLDVTRSIDPSKWSQTTGSY